MMIDMSKTMLDVCVFDGYLGYKQLTGCQLFLIGLDFAVGIGLSALQLLATIHKGLDL